MHLLLHIIAWWSYINIKHNNISTSVICWFMCHFLKCIFRQVSYLFLSIFSHIFIPHIYTNVSDKYEVCLHPSAELWNCCLDSVQLPRVPISTQTRGSPQKSNYSLFPLRRLLHEVFCLLRIFICPKTPLSSGFERWTWASRTFCTRVTFQPFRTHE